MPIGKLAERVALPRGTAWNQSVLAKNKDFLVKIARLRLCADSPKRLTIPARAGKRAHNDSSKMLRPKMVRPLAVGRSGFRVDCKEANRPNRLAD